MTSSNVKKSNKSQEPWFKTEWGWRLPLLFASHTLISLPHLSQSDIMGCILALLLLFNLRLISLRRISSIITWLDINIQNQTNDNRKIEPVTFYKKNKMTMANGACVFYQKYMSLCAGIHSCVLILCFWATDRYYTALSPHSCFWLAHHICPMG